MTVQNEMLALIQQLYTIITQIGSQNIVLKLKLQSCTQTYDPQIDQSMIDQFKTFQKVIRTIDQLKKQFLVQVYADGKCNKKDLIIADNYINRLLSLVDQTKQCTDSFYITDFDKDFDHIQECCEFAIQKICDKKSRQLFCCDIPMYQDPHLTNIVMCMECGNQQFTNKKIQRPDKSETKNKGATYAAMKHFDACFKNIFIGHQEHIESEVIDQIKLFMRRDRKSRVAIEDIRQYLKQVNCTYGPKYNKLDAQIMQQVNGDKQLKLTNKEYNFIKEFYLVIITVFYEINYKRNNTPNCAFFIKKIINLLYTDVDEKKRQECNKLIFVQKESTINKISKIWQDICKLIDIQQIQNDFAELLKK